MTRATSLYLDLVRFLAAVAVLLTHLGYTRFSGGLLLPLRTYGNDAVMVFFVLSGYVIAHTAATRDREFNEYLLNRAARLLSVAVPAVALTLFCDQVGRAIEPAAYAGFWYQDSHAWLRILTALTFTNELWFTSWRLFTNGPYWSLGYEFWYYMLFAAGFYFRGRTRVIALVALCAMLGPKILLLFPIWLLGVWVYRFNRRAEVGIGLGWLLFLGSIAAYVAFRAWGLRDALLEWSYVQFGYRFIEHSLRWSNEFVSSYALGLIVAANFIGCQAISAQVAPLLERFQAPIRQWAGYTFSIYLFHYPLLQLFAATGFFDPHSPWAVAGLFVCTLWACRFIGDYSEQKKAWVRDRLRSIVQPVIDGPRAPAGAQTS